MQNSELSLLTDGAQHFPAAASTVLATLQSAIEELPSQRPGIRIQGIKALSPILASSGVIGKLAAAFLGGDCFSVRAVLFDKSPGTNWSLAWHQDRTICVKKRIDVEGYGPWTTKQGMLHVAPPFALLARMITLRVHLDDVPLGNAPLLISPGSHTAGQVPVERYAAVVEQFGTFACLARAGDVWAYATPILHASNAAIIEGRRRVLQIDYAAYDLPAGLEWLGI